ncbi:uncharacterized protein LOC116555845 [Sapajus apella]|uniref:Uncharacterized protein LOC116555845 n=1 Tax=Sapajus apella TaxID=9515 RepID=A0A6J3IFA3_SAPAP|nr:uncharacterized protein LOC116555845 [Sapajus apella]
MSRESGFSPGPGVFGRSCAFQHLSSRPGPGDQTRAPCRRSQRRGQGAQGLEHAGLRRILFVFHLFPPPGVQEAFTAPVTQESTGKAKGGFRGRGFRGRGFRGRGFRGRGFRGRGFRGRGFRGLRGVRVRPVEAALRACRKLRDPGCLTRRWQLAASLGAAGARRSVGRRGRCGVSARIAVLWSPRGGGAAVAGILGCSPAAPLLSPGRFLLPRPAGGCSGDHAAALASRAASPHDGPLGAGSRRCLAGVGMGEGGRALGSHGLAGPLVRSVAGEPEPRSCPASLSFDGKAQGENLLNWKPHTASSLGRGRRVGCVRLGAGSLRSSASRTERAAAGRGRSALKQPRDLAGLLVHPGFWPLPPRALPWLSWSPLLDRGCRLACHLQCIVAASRR